MMKHLLGMLLVCIYNMRKINSQLISSNFSEETGGRNYSAQIMFFCFVISITLIVMNLLLAVTINNTENLAERSKLLLAKRRIDDVLLATKYPKWLSKLMTCFSKNCTLPIVKWFVKRRMPILQWGSLDQKTQERKTKVNFIKTIRFDNVLSHF